MAKQKKETKQDPKDVLADLTAQQESVKATKKTEREESKKNWTRFQSWRDNPKDKLFTTKTYTSVWVTLSKFVSVYGDLTKLFSISGRGTSDGDRKEAKIKSAGLKYELERIPNGKMAQVLQMMQLVVDGWTVLKAGWDDERMGLSYPYIKNDDIYFDPTAILTSDIEWIHHRRIMTYRQLEQMTKNTIYSGIDAFLKEAVAYRKEELHIDNENPYSDSYAVYECWTKDRVRTMASKQKVSDEGDIEFDSLFRDDPNPFSHGRIPFAVACFDPTGDSVKGYGIPQIVHSPQAELDAVRKLHLQIAELSVSGLWGINENGLGDFYSVIQDVLQKGAPGVFPINKFENVHRYDQPPNQSIFLEEKILKEDIDDASASYPSVSGAVQPRKETLGAIRIQNVGGNERQAVRLNIFSDALKDIGNMFLETLYQYHDRQIEVKIFDGDKELWEKTKFKGTKQAKFDLVLEVAPSAQTQAERQEKLLKVLEIISKIPEMMRTTDMELLRKVILSAIDPKFEHQFTLEEKDVFMNALKEINEKNPEDLKKIVATGQQVLESGISPEQLQHILSQVLQAQGGGQGGAEPPPVTQPPMTQ